MKKNHLWILVCDGGRARVLARSSPGAALAPVAGLTRAVELPRSAELGSERPGRTHESHGAARHAYEPRSDAHDKLEAEFLEGILADLDSRRQKGEFERLVIVAPPRALGILRTKVPSSLSSAIVAEIDKDLTKTADGEIAELIAGTVRV